MDDRFDFDREQDVVTGSHQRVFNRDSMFLHARVVRAGRPDIPLRVRNLSAGGMMAETEHPFAVGDTLDVELRTIGMVSARIAWVRPSRIGVAFDSPVDPKLARKAPAQSPGAGLDLIRTAASAKRPALRPG